MVQRQGGGGGARCGDRPAGPGERAAGRGEKEWATGICWARVRGKVGGLGCWFWGWETGEWAMGRFGLCAGLGLDMSFLFFFSSSISISNTTQTKHHLNSNSNLNSNLALKQKNNAPACMHKHVELRQILIACETKLD